MAQVGSLLPANGEEALLAAQYVAANAQALDCLRLAREHPRDLRIGLQCMAQAASMMRQARSARALMMRVQAQRQRREASNAATDSAAWIEHCAIGLMSDALQPSPAPRPPPVTETQHAAEPAAQASECTPNRTASVCSEDTLRHVSASATSMDVPLRLAASASSGGGPASQGMPPGRPATTAAPAAHRPNDQPPTPHPQPDAPDIAPHALNPQPDAPAFRQRAPNPEALTPIGQPIAASPRPHTPDPQVLAPVAQPPAPNDRPHTPNPQPHAPIAQPTAPSDRPHTPNPPPTAPSPRPHAPDPQSHAPIAQPTTPSEQPCAPVPLQRPRDGPGSRAA